MTDLITAEDAKKLLDECDSDGCLTCEYARSVIALHAQLADAQAARAMVVERCAEEAVRTTAADGQRNIKDQWRAEIGEEVASAIRALAPIDGLALVQELREQVERRGRMHMSVVKRMVQSQADRDRLAAANAALEARVAGLVEAAEDAEYDLLQWLECSKALTAAGFNMDGTAEVTAKLTAALSHIKRGKTNG